MITYIVEAEEEGEEFFARHLAGHDLRFVATAGEIGADAEIVSTFINVRLDAAFLAAHPRIQLIATRSQAIDHIDIDACRARDVRVANVPNYGNTTVAEHTFALLLAVSRRLRELMMQPKNNGFSYAAARGFDLAGKTLGIIGMGLVGRRVAMLGEAFQMKVIASDVKEPADHGAAAHVEFVPHEDLFRRSHVISLHAPLTPETYHIINRETLALCQPGVIVVNTARGALIETAALVEALESGQVGGAGLDVLEDERVLRQSASRIIAADIVEHLRSDALAHEARDAERVREVEQLMLGDAVLARSNVVFTPHVAFNSAEAVARLREGTVANICAFAAGKLANAVA